VPSLVDTVLDSPLGTTSTVVACETHRDRKPVHADPHPGAGSASPLAAADAR
jgi:hypothetical protein